MLYNVYIQFLSLFVRLTLWLVNFYDTTTKQTHRWFETTLNKQLESRVLYYAMYSKSDKEVFYTCLYDYTSLWARLKLVLCSIIYTDYLSNQSVFTYDEVYNNVENLTSFMIDAVVITYIKDSKTVNRILSYKDEVVPTKECLNETVQKVNFIYAIMSTEGKEYDFTNEFNTHVCDIIGSPLTLEDFLSIFNARFKQGAISNNEIADATLKIMTESDFTELLLKTNDQLCL